MRQNYQQGFLLIRYNVKMRCVEDNYSRQWASVRPYKITGFKNIYTRVADINDDTAERLIKQHGLVCVSRSVDGEIWDTPDRDFQKAWKGKITFGQWE